jgi:hypothetical protein
MKLSKWIVFGWLAILLTAQADDLNCTQPFGIDKKFVRCGKATVQADIPLDARETLSILYPESKILSGDLDQDGTKDFVVYATEHADDGLVYQLIILKSKPGGGYEELGKSSSIQFGTPNIEIKNNSLYLQVNHTSVNESHDEIYQFKIRDGHVFLIGKEDITYVPTEKKHGNESRTTTNHLSGELIKSMKVNGKTTSTTKEKTERKLLRLEDFSR